MCEGKLQGGDPGATVSGSDVAIRRARSLTLRW